MALDPNNVSPGYVWSQVVRVLPDQLLEQMITTKGALSDLRWDMGRQANAVYSYVVGNALPYTRVQVCGAVAHFYDDVRSMSSILRYAMVAEFFPVEIVEAYGWLPFSHFEYAQQLGKRWRDVLEESVRLSDGRGGVPPSVKALVHIFQPVLSEQQAADEIDEIVRLENGGAVAPQLDGFSDQAGDGGDVEDYFPADDRPQPPELPAVEEDLAVSLQRDLDQVSRTVSQLSSALPRLQRWSTAFPTAARKLAQAQVLIDEAVRELQPERVPLQPRLLVTPRRYQ